jgi:hypothetical protein
VFWVLMSELFSMRAKSAAISACTALLFATGAVTAGAYTRSDFSPTSALLSTV